MFTDILTSPRPSTNFFDILLPSRSDAGSGCCCSRLQGRRQRLGEAGVPPSLGAGWEQQSTLARTPPGQCWDMFPATRLLFRAADVYIPSFNVNGVLAPYSWNFLGVCAWPVPGKGSRPAGPPSNPKCNDGCTRNW